MVIRGKRISKGGILKGRHSAVKINTSLYKINIYANMSQIKMLNASLFEYVSC
jgi:hypothetical protein